MREELHNVLSNALISSLPRLAQDRPIKMAEKPETLTVRQRQTSILIPSFKTTARNGFKEGWWTGKEILNERYASRYVFITEKPKAVSRPTNV